MMRETSSRSSMICALRPGVALDGLDGPLRPSAVVEAAAGSEPGPAEDGVERRAQLVRDGAQELVLEAVGLLGPAARLLLARTELAQRRGLLLDALLQLLGVAAQLGLLGGQGVGHGVEGGGQLAHLVALLQADAARHVAGGDGVRGLADQPQGAGGPPRRGEAERDRQERRSAPTTTRLRRVCSRERGQDGALRAEDAVDPALAPQRHERGVHGTPPGSRSAGGDRASGRRAASGSARRARGPARLGLQELAGVAGRSAARRPGGPRCPRGSGSKGRKRSSGCVGSLRRMPSASQRTPASSWPAKSVSARDDLVDPRQGHPPEGRALDRAVRRRGPAPRRRGRPGRPRGSQRGS